MRMPRTPKRQAAAFITAVVTVAASIAGAQQAESVPRSNIVLPQHRVLLPEITESSVRIETVDVSVAIREQIATTTVTILLRNPARSPQESQLLMPVPDGAMVRQFRLEGLPNEGVAKVLPRDEARRIYQDIVRRAKDPGLVEFVGYNLIQSSVFPVPAGGTQTIDLVYEQVLEADGPRVDYVLPRSESLEATGVKWSLSATIEASRPIGTVYSPSHELATERNADGNIRVAVPATSAANPGAFRLSYVLTQPDGLAASIMAYPDPRVGPDGQGGYFMLMLGLPAEADRPRIKREVTLVLDRSGSMRGEKIIQAREAALQVLGGLEDGEFFNIIDYSDNVERFSPRSVAKDKDSLARAERYLESLAAVGGTNLHDALVEALAAEPPAEALPMVLFLTDGLATVGVRGERDIREAARRANTHGRRIFPFGVGFDVNSPLLSALSTASRGSATFVLPDEDIEVKVGQVFKRLRGPVLVEPELGFESVTHRSDTASPLREILPGSLSDVFEGEQVLVFGQYLHSREVLFTLTGRDASGEAVHYQVVFDPANASVRHSYVPRIWAMRKIGSLIDEIRSSGADGSAPDTELVDEVIRLSTEFGILTEYTAFLAVEENEMFRSDAFGAPVPDANAPQQARDAAARREIVSRNADRSSRSGVSQEINAKRQAEAGSLNLRNSLDYDAGDGLGSASFVSVRQNADMTLYRRGERWLDARLLETPDAEPEDVIEFASEAYFTLVERLAAEHRQSVLAVPGDVYLLLDGRRTLVRQAP